MFVRRGCGVQSCAATVMDPPGIAGSRAHDRCGKVRSLSFSLFITAFANAQEVIITIVIIMIIILIAVIIITIIIIIIITIIILLLGS